MRRLLNAGFYRLKNDRIFQIAVLAVILASLVMLYNGTRSFHVMAENGYVRPMEKYFFNQAPMMGLFFSLFVSLFLGTEYADGTIRNKLCVGHRREHIYLTHFIVCLTANLLFLILWVLCCSPMLFLIGPPEMGTTTFLTYLAVAVGFTTALSSLFVMIAMNTTSKAYSVVFTVGIWMVLLLSASGIYDRLGEPELNGGMAMINGQFVEIEPTPNPLYVAGGAQIALEHILDFLPTGPTLLMNAVEITHPARQVVFALVFTVLTLWVGLKLFRKKDIR